MNEIDKLFLQVTLAAALLVGLAACAPLGVIDNSRAFVVGVVRDGYGKMSHSCGHAPCREGRL